jgi:hypothetical protein
MQFLRNLLTELNIHQRFLRPCEELHPVVSILSYACHFPPLFRRAYRRSGEWTTLIR